MKINTLSALTVIAFSCILSMSSFAQPQGPNGGPPPEAIDACVGKSSGDQVSFETPRGDTLKCTCKEIQGQLVAVPKGHKMRVKN